MKKLTKKEFKERQQTSYYNKITEVFFRELTKCSKNSYYGCTPFTIIKKNFDSYNGCYNSFKIKEAPDFLFGIWWQPETHVDIIAEYDGKTGKRTIHKEVREYLKGAFFADFEEEVDKFKPWRCYFNVYFTVREDSILKKRTAKDPGPFAEPSNYGTSPLLDICAKINYIINEHDLAFCTCYCGFSPYTYHTRDEAAAEYKKYLEYKGFKELEKKQALKEQFDYFKNLFNSYNLTQGSDYIVKDVNLNSHIISSPRFEIFFNIGKESQQYLEKPSKHGFMGVYGIGDILGADDQEAKKMHDDFWNFRDKLNKKFNLIFSLDVDFFCVAVTPKKFASLKRTKSIIDLDRPDLIDLSKGF